MNAIKLEAWNTHTPSTKLVKPTYGFIDSSKIIERFESKGWKCISAKQAATKNIDREGYQKHLLKFTHNDFSVVEGLSSDNKTRPELVLLNSHDGTSAMRLFFGFTRIACLNGIIAGTAFNSIRLIHNQNMVKGIDNAIETMVNGLPDVLDKVRHYSNIPLSESQMMELAHRAAELRLTNTKGIQDINLYAMFNLNRYQDKGSDAYTLFNVIQEKVIRGGIKYKQLNEKTNFVEKRTTRAISSVSQSVKLNQGLWNILEEITA
jgi:hypothetical protein